MRKNRWRGTAGRGTVYRGERCTGREAGGLLDEGTEAGSHAAPSARVRCMTTGAPTN